MTAIQTKLLLIAGTLVGALFLSGAAFADEPARPAAPADTTDCTTKADPSQKGDRVPKGNENLSKKLDDCNGVLKAPDAGDKGMVTPAPETGNSRVIKPGDVPKNANPSNGSGG